MGQPSGQAGAASLAAKPSPLFPAPLPLQIHLNLLLRIRGRDGWCEPGLSTGSGSGLRAAMSQSRPLLLRAINREPVERPPIWFMRQAGRCLPEYRELRAKVGGFLELCMNPETAAEVTLQPMRRFAYDAAIVFADILTLPMAMGQALWFEAGEGPRFGALPPLESLEAR